MNDSVLLNLVCLPFAGAGASVYNDWKEVSERLNVMAIQLPGREQRFVEPAYTDVYQAIEGILPEVLEQMNTSKPVVVFGHSLGAVLAFELARTLNELDEITVAGLVVSGSLCPWDHRKKRATGLSDEDFFSCVNDFAGYSHPALEDPIMRELLLPMLRADVEMHENYHPQSEEKLALPIVTLRGEHDELVTSEDKQLWSKASSVSVLHKEMSGGHMYLMEEYPAIIRLVEDAFL